MADEPKPPSARQVIQSVTIPNHYVNGFEISNSLSDIGILLMLDGQPQARLSLSFTTAKTFARDLSAAVAVFEKATKHTIMTMDEVREGLEKDESYKSRTK